MDFHYIITKIYFVNSAFRVLKIFQEVAKLKLFNHKPSMRPNWGVNWVCSTQLTPVLSDFWIWWKIWCILAKIWCKLVETFWQHCWRVIFCFLTITNYKDYVNMQTKNLVSNRDASKIGKIFVFKFPNDFGIKN